MSRYRKVHTKMWTSEDFRALSPPPPCGQSLWIHLLTGQQTTAIPGVMATGIARLAEQLRWPFEGTRAALKEILGQGMALFDEAAGLLYVPRAFDHDRPANPNVIKHWREAWNDLPPCPLKARAWRDLHTQLKAIGEPHAVAFVAACKRPKATPLTEAEPNNNGYGNGSPNGLPNGSPKGSAKGSAAPPGGAQNGFENPECVSKTNTSDGPKTPVNMAFTGSDPNNNGYGNGLAKQEQEAGTGSQTAAAAARASADARATPSPALGTSAHPLPIPRPGPGEPAPGPAPASPPDPTPERRGATEETLSGYALALLAALRQSAHLGPIATPCVAEELGARTTMKFPVAWTVQAIDDADRSVGVKKATGAAFDAEGLAVLVAKFCSHARAPRALPTGRPELAAPPPEHDRIPTVAETAARLAAMPAPAPPEEAAKAIAQIAELMATAGTPANALLTRPRRVAR